MTEEYQPICVEQILVSLDSSKHSFSALKAAMQLAGHYGARLRGVFIEDTILLNLAAMEILQEVGEYTAITREISTDGITRGMVVQSRWITRSFKKMIIESGLDGEISILRGRVPEIINQEAERCDLIVIGKRGTHPIGRPRLGSTARALIQKGEKPLLLVEENNLLGYPIFVLFQDSALGWKALETGRELLGSGENLNIWIETFSPEGTSMHQDKIRDWAIERQINIVFRPYKIDTFHRNLQKVAQLETGLVIMPHIREKLISALIEKCLRNVSMPILLIQ